MSGFSVDVKKIESNWNELAEDGDRTDGMVTINCDESDRTLYFGFEVSCKGKNGNKVCQGHLNLMHGFNPAHLTLLSWNGSKKTNYWYAVSPNGTISDSKAPPGKGSSIQGTSVGISSLPSDISGALKRIITATYAGAL